MRRCLIWRVWRRGLRRWLLSTACTALAFGSAAYADTSASSLGGGVGLGYEPVSYRPVYAADAMDMDMGRVGRAPLMSLLDKAGLAAPLDKVGIDIYGF